MYRLKHRFSASALCGKVLRKMLRWDLEPPIRLVGLAGLGWMPLASAVLACRRGGGGILGYIRTMERKLEKLLRYIGVI